MANELDPGISTLDREMWGLDANFPPAPESNGWMPMWCHPHANKMMLVREDQEEYDSNKLKIKGIAAEVSISDFRQGSDYWAVDWKVVQSRNEFSQGRILMRTQNLERAFGLSDEPGRYGIAILKKYGGTTAHQGAYIRYQNFLNIPGPGTGHDGDPNVSIDLYDDMKEAVRKFISK